MGMSGNVDAVEVNIVGDSVEVMWGKMLLCVEGWGNRPCFAINI